MQTSVGCTIRRRVPRGDGLEGYEYYDVIATAGYVSAGSLSRRAELLVVTRHRVSPRHVSVVRRNAAEDRARTHLVHPFASNAARHRC